MESSERVEIELPSDFIDASIDHLALLIGVCPVDFLIFLTELHPQVICLNVS